MANSKERSDESDDKGGNRTDDFNVPPLSSFGLDATSSSPENETSQAGISKNLIVEIGPYRIVREIGEGGMGSVYEAQQLEPVKRKVAIKVIKAGRDSKSVIARFEAERQALAMMDHPSIARIIDAGTTELGQPFFAMELVGGVPLTTYCDDHSLSINDRLQLFCQICDGIQHAHQKGIIHRDLKPGNILVTEYDGKSVPKIIDFGLAKALETTPKLTDKSIHTEFGQVLGTIKYMSPEQAGLDAMDIDTRTDIYSLGIILYELLIGSTPLDSSSIKENALLKVLELVREQEALKPSSKLSTDSGRQSKISSRRQIEPKKLQSILSGELDWVVMKSLEKDRNRRYASANEFAEDVKRYLNEEPILARPPSRSYQLQKFVRKNQGLVASLATIAALLIAGIGGTTWFALGQQAAKQLANERAEQSRKDKLAAEKSAKRSKDSLEIFIDSFRSVDPHEGADSDMLAKDVLFRAKESLEKSDLDDKGKAELLAALTSSFLGVGEFDTAVSTAGQVLGIRENTVGPEHLDTVAAMNVLANCYKTVGRYSEALELYEKVLKLWNDSLGHDSRYTLAAMNNVASSMRYVGRIADAIQLQERTLELYLEKLGPDHVQSLNCANNLANSYYAMGRYDEAIKLMKNTLEHRKGKFGLDHPSTLVSMSNLAAAYGSTKRYEDKLKLNLEVLNLRKEKLGEDHPATLVSMNNLANGYGQTGQFDKSIALLKKTLKLRQDKLGVTHPDTLVSMGSLANGYLVSGKFAESVKISEQLLEIRKNELGSDHPDTLSAMHGLASGYYRKGMNGAAKQLMQKTIELRQRKLGHDHPDTLKSMTVLAGIHGSDSEESVQLYKQLFKLKQGRFGRDHQETLKTMSRLAYRYWRTGHTDEAIKTYQDLLRLRQDKLGNKAPETLRTMSDLAASYRKKGQTTEALEMDKVVFELRREKLGLDHVDTLYSMTNLAHSYQQAGQLANSISLLEQAVELSTRSFGRDHPDTQSKIARLAWNYKDAGRLDEAIQLFEESFENRKEVDLNWMIPHFRNAYIQVKRSAKLKHLVDELVSEARESKEHDLLNSELLRGGSDLLAVAAFEEAEELFEEYWGRLKNKSRESWETFNAESLLGVAILNQGRVEDAMPLLINGYQGIKIRIEEVPKTEQKKVLLDAANRLMELANDSGDEQQRQNWRTELDWIENEFGVSHTDCESTQQSIEKKQKR
ncbi:MAG: tetratricopeptide repeat protein [Planctomycetota bacterium]